MRCEGRTHREARAESTERGCRGRWNRVVRVEARLLRPLRVAAFAVVRAGNAGVLYEC